MLNNDKVYKAHYTEQNVLLAASREWARLRNHIYRLARHNWCRG